MTVSASLTALLFSLLPPLWLASIIAVVTGIVTANRGKHDHLRRFVSRIVIAGAALLTVAAIQLAAGTMVMVVAAGAGRSMFLSTWIFAVAGMLLLAPGAAVALTIKTPKHPARKPASKNTSGRR
jgi:uncharacterized membrane protein YfcA